MRNIAKKCGTVIRHYEYEFFKRYVRELDISKLLEEFCIYITCISRRKGGYQKRGTTERKKIRKQHAIRGISLKVRNSKETLPL